jgi:hypothetical protein
LGSARLTYCAVAAIPRDAGGGAGWLASAFGVLAHGHGSAGARELRDALWLSIFRLTPM